MYHGLLGCKCGHIQLGLLSVEFDWCALLSITSTAKRAVLSLFCDPTQAIVRRPQDSSSYGEHNSCQSEKVRSLSRLRPHDLMHSSCLEMQQLVTSKSDHDMESMQCTRWCFVFRPCTTLSSWYYMFPHHVLLCNHNIFRLRSHLNRLRREWLQTSGQEILRTQGKNNCNAPLFHIIISFTQTVISLISSLGTRSYGSLWSAVERRTCSHISSPYVWSSYPGFGSRPQFVHFISQCREWDWIHNLYRCWNPWTELSPLWCVAALFPICM